MRISFLATALLFCAAAFGQKTEAEIYKGNEHYKKKEYDKAEEQYKKALSKDPSDPRANFNGGNAAYRQSKYEDAATSFDNTINNTKDQKLQQQAYYNKGVSLVKQQKLEESIDAWKQSLKLDPNDKESRENLEKALRELKKKQQQEQEQKKNKKDQKKEQQKNEKEQQQPQKPQSRLTQQRVEQLLKALQQKEKEVNAKLNQAKVASPNKPEKDW